MLRFFFEATVNRIRNESAAALVSGKFYLPIRFYYHTFRSEFV
jgi:hypothetical protein